MRGIFSFSFKSSNHEDTSYYKVSIDLNEHAFLPFQSVLEKYSREKTFKVKKVTQTGDVILGRKMKIVDEKCDKNFLNFKKSVCFSYIKAL